MHEINETGKIDKKTIYSLLCNKDLLQYLNTSDKREFSSSCKFIFEKCIRFRLENFRFFIRNLNKAIDNINEEKLSARKKHRLRLKYIDDVVYKYKNYLLNYACFGYNFDLIEYFSTKFCNLNSIYLKNVIIPKENLKNIVESLPRLRSLVFEQVKLTYMSKPQQNVQFQFPKCFNKLECNDCFEFMCHSKNPWSLKKEISLFPLSKFSTMNLSVNSLNSLKYLSWNNFLQSDTEFLNNLLSNNLQLTTLVVSIKVLNAELLTHISNNRNLTRLKLINVGSKIELNKEHIIMQPHIKVLEVQHISEKNVETLTPLIESCLNLEELNYIHLANCDSYIANYIKNLPKIKLLTINIKRCPPTILSTILPESNLECLKICSKYPIKLNFNNFCNLKKLKKIRNTEMITRNAELWNTYLRHGEIQGWKIIYYADSIDYWKV